MALDCQGCKKKDHTAEDCDYGQRGIPEACTCQHRQGCKVIEDGQGNKVIAPPGVTRVDIR